MTGLRFFDPATALRLVAKPDSAAVANLVAAEVLSWPAIAAVKRGVAD